MDKDISVGAAVLVLGFMILVMSLALAVRLGQVDNQLDRIEREAKK